MENDEIPDGTDVLVKILTSKTGDRKSVRRCGTVGMRRARWFCLACQSGTAINGGFAADAATMRIHEITNLVTSGVERHYASIRTIALLPMTPKSASRRPASRRARPMLWAAGSSPSRKRYRTSAACKPVALKAVMGVNPKGCYGGKQESLGSAWASHSLVECFLP